MRKLVNVNKFYTVEKESIKVLNGIDLDIPANKITVILGRSGCGKTTLLNVISGLDKIDKRKNIIINKRIEKNMYL